MKKKTNTTKTSEPQFPHIGNYEVSERHDNANKIVVDYVKYVGYPDWSLDVSLPAELKDVLLSCVGKKIKITIEIS